MVGTAIKTAVSAPYRIAHATFELECEGCVDDGEWRAMTDLEPTSNTDAGHAH